MFFHYLFLFSCVCVAVFVSVYMDACMCVGLCVWEVHMYAFVYVDWLDFHPAFTWILKGWADLIGKCFICRAFSPALRGNQWMLREEDSTFCRSKALDRLPNLKRSSLNTYTMANTNRLSRLYLYVDICVYMYQYQLKKQLQHSCVKALKTSKIKGNKQK